MNEARYWTDWSLPNKDEQIQQDRDQLASFQMILRL